MKNLEQIDVLIAVRIADSYRVNNLINSVNSYLYNFKVSITVLEVDRVSKSKQVIPHLLAPINWWFIHSEEETFHRTRWMNQLGRLSKKPILVYHDMDVLLYPHSVAKFYDAFTNGGYEWGHPFGAGTLKSWSIPMDDQDRLIYRKYLFQGHDIYQYPSGVGYCIWAQKDYFFRCHGWNEKLVAYSPDDIETTYRLKKYGGKYMQAQAPVFHIEHPRNHNSSMNLNPHFQSGVAEWEAVRQKNAEQLDAHFSERTPSSIVDYEVLSGAA